MRGTKVRKCVQAFTVAAVVALVGMDAHATVSLNGSACQPYYPQESTTFSANISRGTNGVTTSNSGYTYLFCSIPRANPGGTGVNINVYFNHGTSSSPTYIYGYSMDSFGNVVASDSVAIVSNSPIPWTSKRLTAVNWGTVGVLGLMTQGDVIHMVGVTE